MSSPYLFCPKFVHGLSTVGQGSYRPDSTPMVIDPLIEEIKIEYEGISLICGTSCKHQEAEGH